MIHKIYINQFKSIKTNTVIELKPLTFLCGPNSAGKSLLHKVLDFFRNWHEKKLNVFAEKFKTQQKGIDQHFSIGIELISSCYGNIPWQIGMRADDPRLASLYEIRDEQTSIDAADPYVLKSFFEYLEAEKIPIKIMVKEKQRKTTAVNINLATSKELQAVSGIGPATATKIINYRIKNGSFSSIKELLSIKGISQNKLSKIERFLKI